MSRPKDYNHPAGGYKNPWFITPKKKKSRTIISGEFDLKILSAEFKSSKAGNGMIVWNLGLKIPNFKQRIIKTFWVLTEGWMRTHVQTTCSTWGIDISQDYSQLADILPKLIGTWVRAKVSPSKDRRFYEVKFLTAIVRDVSSEIPIEQANIQKREDQFKLARLKEKERLHRLVLAARSKEVQAEEDLPQELLKGKTGHDPRVTAIYSGEEFRPDQEDERTPPEPSGLLGEKALDPQV